MEVSGNARNIFDWYKNQQIIFCIVARGYVCVIISKCVESSIKCSKVQYVFFLFAALDRMSCTNELTKKIPAAKVALTILFVTFFYGRTNVEAVLYHCQIDNERRTFLKGRWTALGLSEYQVYDCSFVFNMATSFKSCVVNNYCWNVTLSILVPL